MKEQKEKCLACRGSGEVTKHPSKEERNRLIYEYSKTLTKEEIAKKFNICRQHVHRVINAQKEIDIL